MKVLIAGTRTFNDPKRMALELQNFLQPFMEGNTIDEVVSGHSGQADLGGERWAKARRIKVQKFEVTKQQWDKYGKAAGPMRNTQMANYLEIGDKAVIFWDGKSHGAVDMANKAIKKLGSENVLVVEY